MGCSNSTNVKTSETGAIVSSRTTRNKNLVAKIEDGTKRGEIRSKDGKIVQDLSPRPPKKTKKEIIPDVSVFAAVDEHALKASNNLRSNIKDLVNYLIKPAKSHLEMVRAFYRWIANNIRYDTESFFSGTHIDSSPAGVLSSGRSVCEGYSRLFEEFCKLVGIPVKKISGYSKGYGWKPGQVVTTDQRTTHAWNAVFILGEWRFIECTWGTGHLDKNGKFCWSFKEFYFLTDPINFIVEHFPYFDNDMNASCSWQLLPKPVSLNSFCASLHLEPLAMELGLQPLTHSTEVVTTGSKGSIRFSYPQKIFKSFTCHLYTENGSNMAKYVMLERLEEKGITLHLLLPKQGIYFLDLYGESKESDSGTHHSLVTYKLQCSDDPKQKATFPEYSQVWGPCAGYQDYGFSDQVTKKVWFVADSGKIQITLDTIKEVDILASVQHAEETIKAPKRYCFIQKKNKTIIVTARLPFEGYYKLSISAKRPWANDNLYWEAITYLIECKQADKSCCPFPRQYQSDLSDVELLEPLDGDLPSNTKTLFRIKAPSLQQVMVISDMLQKKGDVFEGTVMTPDVGKSVTIYGSSGTSGSLDGLFQYEVV